MRSISKRDRDRRRLQVFRLSVRGWDLERIAQHPKVNVSIGVVKQDLAAIRAEVLTQIDRTTIDQIVAEERAVYAELERSLWDEHQLALEPPNAQLSNEDRARLARRRMQALDQIRQARVDRRAAMIDAGLYPAKLRAEGLGKPTLTMPISEDQAAAIAQIMMQGVTRGALAEPIPDDHAPPAPQGGTTIEIDPEEPLPRERR